MSSFNTALASGLNTGTRIGSDLQELDLAKQRLALAMQAQTFDQEQGRQRMALANREEDRRDAADQYGRDLTRQSQAWNAEEYGQLVAQPAMRQAFETDTSEFGTGYLDQAQAIQAQQGRFAGADPRTQEDVLASARSIRSRQMIDQITQQAADARLQRQIMAIESSGLKPETKELLKLQAQGLHTDSLSRAQMTEQDYANSPAFAQLPQQYRQPAMSFLRNHGSPPPKEWLGSTTAAQSQANAEARLRLSEATAYHSAASKQWDMANATLQEFRKANKDALLPPVDATGQPLPMTNQTARLHVQAKQYEAKYEAAVRAAQKQMDDAFSEMTSLRQPQQQPGAAAPIAPDNAGPDPYRAAAARVAERRPDLDPDNPADLAEFERELQAELGQY